MTWLGLAAVNGAVLVATLVHGRIVNRRVSEARREVHDEWMEWFRAYLREQRP